jgi:hypothetical protein
MTNQDKTNKAIALGKKFCPDYNVKLKSSSWVQKAIGWVLGKIGNKDYMNSYCTTMGQTTYVPNMDGDYLWATLLHEIQHAKDAQKISNTLFGTAYLMPQLLGILGVFYTLVVSIGCVFGWPLALLWGCTSLLCLAPLPAFGRAYIEVRGYTVSLAVYFWAGVLQDEQAYIEFLVNTFSSGAYYFMWPFKSWVRSYFQQKLQELKTGQFQLDAYLAACKVLAKDLAN